MIEKENSFQLKLHQALEYFLIYSLIDAPLRPLTKSPYLSANPLKQLAESIPEDLATLIDRPLPDKNQISAIEYSEYLSAVYRLWEQVISQAGGERRTLPIGGNYDNWLRRGGKRRKYRAVHKLYRLMARWGETYFVRGIVHGSVGTMDDQPGFSDLDLAFIIRREILTSSFHLNNLRKLSARVIALSFAFDPYMHHGPFFLTEIDLLRYMEPLCPILLFDYGINLIPNAPQIKVWTHFRSELSMSQIDSVNQVLSRQLSMGVNNLDRFELQWLLSGVLFLILIYCQLKNKEFRYKRDVFNLVRDDFDSSLWEPVDIATRIRKELPMKKKIPLKLAWLFGRLCKPGYIQRWARRRKSAQVSKEMIQNNLGNDYLVKAQQLFYEVCKKIETLPEENVITAYSSTKTLIPAPSNSDRNLIQLYELGNGPFCQIPRCAELEEYDRATQYLLDCWKALSPRPISIYKVGGINTPGISDLDFVIVFENSSAGAWKALQKVKLPKWIETFLTHPPFVCDRNSWKYIQTWLPIFDFQLLEGEDLEILDVPELCVEGWALGTAIDYLMLKLPRDIIISASRKPLFLKDHLCVLYSIKHTFRLLGMAGIELTKETNNLVSTIARLRKDWFDLGWERFEYLKRLFLQAVIACGEAISLVDDILIESNITKWLDANNDRLRKINSNNGNFNFISNWSLESALIEFESNGFIEKYWPNPFSFAAVISLYTTELPGLSAYLGYRKAWYGDRWAEGLSYRAKGLKVYAEGAMSLGLSSVRHIAWDLTPFSLLHQSSLK